MATSIDDNAADEKSDKSIWRLLNIHCTNIISIYKTQHPRLFKKVTRRGCAFINIYNDFLITVINIAPIVSTVKR